MKIEEEIQTTFFEDNYHKVTVNLNYTYGWMANFTREQFEKYNLTVQQVNILRILRDQYPSPARISLLKERMVDKMPDASRIIVRLIQKNMVSRCTNNTDRRAVDIRISDTGLDMLAKIDKVFKARDFLKQHLSEKEAGQLSDLLDKLRGK
jgi:DNA-binding MarR family transcriptional regulator